ncbi:hypothetical protein B7P43_G18114 [Cryptotermes secundus]|uniref:Uncharacterized protein n=1 Tax=Cryptotermes secundus TaxID=105785 RepID=A0A2J7PYC8_9NEOP|nr:hypothetical protein B7P43_G18114 [Cryptotermes secundus]
MLALGFAANTHVSKVQRLEKKVLRNNTNIPRRRAVSTQKPQKIVKMQMFGILDKAKPDRTRGLNFAAVKLVVVEVTKLLV